MRQGSFKTIRPGGDRAAGYGYGGVPLLPTPNGAYVFGAATAPCGYRLQFGAGPPACAGTAGDTSRVAVAASLARLEVTAGGAMRSCGPGVDNAVPHRFGGRGPMLNGRCPGRLGAIGWSPLLFSLARRSVAQAARASAHGPLVWFSGGRDAGRR